MIEIHIQGIRSILAGARIIIIRLTEHWIHGALDGTLKHRLMAHLSPIQSAFI
ncbi:MAG: hypothetical protein VKL39_00215 [Leptolyngbyaceae bacterium]|nr:hypothetical protein [Leptolyngbyaceae bacterium]